LYFRSGILVFNELKAAYRDKKVVGDGVRFRRRFTNLT
jgi:hypothetical protein